MTKRKILVPSFLLLAIVLLASPLVVLATGWSDPSGDTPAQLQDLEVVFARIIGIALPLGGLALIVMLIVGGFQYLTAGDNPKNAEQASKTLTSAVVGLVVLIGAWIILRTIEIVTRLNITTFRIPSPYP